ncbi:MAG: glycosyl transferase family 2 [Elusimicrobia bacterium RIFOXYB2_FULL_49_7]|nr:MAG: glycosyl transferase family 2 [Elusimicrobia bacterium RIFOXYB2_FULL_49_7]
MKTISIIIPLLNEAESLPELTEQIAAQISKMPGYDYEILFINDGSTDASMEVIRTLAETNQRIKCLSFAKNYGKAAALSVGFKQAAGDFMITMDADLQDDPAEIPELIQKLSEGFDLVSGWKKVRHDPVLSKNLPSKFFNWTTSKVSGIRLHDFNCGLKAYRKTAAKSLNFYGEMHRYLPVLCHWNGFKVTEKPVLHHPRKYGTTKYGISRFFKGFLDLLTITFLRQYMRNPMHLFGFLGMLFTFAGLAVTAYFGVLWIIEGALHLRPLMLLGVGAILMGIQFFSIGLIGEMITHTSKREDYVINEEINLA